MSCGAERGFRKAYHDAGFSSVDVLASGSTGLIIRSDGLDEDSSAVGQAQSGCQRGGESVSLTVGSLDGGAEIPLHGIPDPGRNPLPRDAGSADACKQRIGWTLGDHGSMVPLLRGRLTHSCTSAAPVLTRA